LINTLFGKNTCKKKTVIYNKAVKYKTFTALFGCDKMLEDTTRINMLYDFYSSLLTGKQREFLELYYQHDLSLAEVAAESGISRQAVHDLLKRAVRTLESAEEKLGLVARFAKQEKALRKLKRLLLADDLTGQARQEALALLDEMLD
jgi:predicted DNA-binding protein YlxM (UPF0122 family)